MSSSMLLQQCPACLVRLTWIVFVIGGRWPYSLCLVRCCRQDLFKIARSILVQLPSSFFSSRFVRVYVVHPYSSIDATTAWKKLRFILSVRSDFHIIDSLLIAAHAFVNLVSMSFSVDEYSIHMKRERVCWCSFSPKLINISIAVDIEHSIWILLPLGCLPSGLALSWLREEAKGTPQKQSRTPTTLMTWRY